MKKTTSPKKKAAKKKTTTTSKRMIKVKEIQYEIPREVSEWITHAHSRIQYLSSEIERLKKENKNLKDYQKFAERKILRSELES